MARTRVSRTDFLNDPQGRTFADVVNDPEQPFEQVLEFFNDPNRQRRMEESELHHDRSPMAGVVRELEVQPAINEFLATAKIKRNTRFRQAIGVLVRMIMQQRGWQKTGRKGSLGTRAAGEKHTPATTRVVWHFGFCGRRDTSESTGCRFSRSENVAASLRRVRQKRCKSDPPATN